VGGIEYPDIVGIADMVVHNQSVAAAEVVRIYWSFSFFG